MTQIDAFAPCPFCGDPVELKENGNLEYLACKGCKGSGLILCWTKDEREKAISQWNKRAKIATLEAFAAKSEITTLRGLLDEAVSDLESYIKADYPKERREAYPSVQQDYENDMEIVNRIRAILKEGKNG